MIDICRSLALLEGPAGDAGTLALIPADCSGHEIVTGRDARTVRNLKTVICENRSGLPRPAIERKDHRHDDTPSCERYSFSVVREREVVAARQKRVALKAQSFSDTRWYSMRRTASSASPRWRMMWNLSNTIRAFFALRSTELRNGLLPLRRPTQLLLRRLFASSAKNNGFSSSCVRIWPTQIRGDPEKTMDVAGLSQRNDKTCCQAGLNVEARQPLVPRICSRAPFSHFGCTERRLFQ
jgi:hypothetical protein